MPGTSFWSDLTGWDLLTLVGIIFVFFGVAGEVIFAIRDFMAPANPYSRYPPNDLNPMPVGLYFDRAAWEAGEARRVKNMRLGETICGSILVLGLLFELVGFVPSLRYAWKEREGLRQANLQLEAKVAHRRLTGEQKVRLSKIVSKVPSSVVIVSGFFDPETADFADDFDAALTNAGWQTVRQRNHTDRPTGRYGISIGTLEGTWMEHESILSNALASIDISCEKRIWSAKDANTISPEFRPGFLYLVIEHKPPLIFSASAKK